MIFSEFKKFKSNFGYSSAFILSFCFHILILTFIILGIRYVPPLKIEGVTITTSANVPGSSRVKKSSADIGPLPPVAKKISPKIKKDEPKPKPPKKAKAGKLDPTKKKVNQVKNPSTKDIKQFKSKSEISRNIEDIQRLLNTVEQLRSQKKDIKLSKSPQKATPKDDLTLLKDALDEVVSKNIDSLGSLEESTGSGLTASDFDILRKQFISCWNIPIGNKNIENFKIVVELKINNLGYVQDANIINSNNSENLAFTSISESVIRAIWHPLCTPLKLPLDSFPIWENMIVTFDPEWVILG